MCRCAAHSDILLLVILYFPIDPGDVDYDYAVITVQILPWRLCLKPRLSRLIKFIPGLPKNPARRVTSQRNFRRKRYFCEQAATALVLTKKETLIHCMSAFEKASVMSLRGSPVNKQTVLINTTWTCQRPHMNRYFAPQKTESVTGHSLQVEDCISLKVNDHH